MFPDVPVIAVKDAARYVKAFALFGMHPAKMPRMVTVQKRIHSDFTTHMSGRQKDWTKFGYSHSFEPDYWWEGCDIGSSTWGARRMASFMGFDIVILCGMPMEVGGYPHGPSMSFNDPSIIERYRREILSDVGFHEGVYSLSGWTREVFGCP